MKFVVPFLVIFLFFARTVFAEETLKISLRDRVYLPTENIVLALDLPNCKNDFRIRPITKSGMIEILNDKKEWISSSNSWFDQPVVVEKMEMRLLNFSDKKASVSFEFQNVKTGEISKSGVISFWVTNVYHDYIDALNTSIMN